MCERKPWTTAQDMLLKQLVEENQGRAQKKTWSDIADIVKRQGSKRTGKQCRQRWNNQLKPGINDRQWTESEQHVLFKLQQKFGNHWAQIAKQLPGRTDNNIKNYFYSTLRKALRKVNSFIMFCKKDVKYRNVKQFKQQTLNKILAVAQKKYQNKINLTNRKVEDDAIEIKKLLVQIQREDASIQHNDKLQTVTDKILEFNRNCKKRKSKKLEEDDNEEEEEIVQQQYKNVTNKQKSSQKSEKSQQYKSSKSIKSAKPIESIKTNINLSDPKLKKLPSASGLNVQSSSFQIFQKCQDNFENLFQSNNFLPFPRLNSIKKKQSNRSQVDFLANIPQFQRRNAPNNDIMQFWKQQSSHHASFNIFETSNNYNKNCDNPMINMSLSLNNSGFLRRSSSKFMQKNKSQL